MRKIIFNKWFFLATLLTVSFCVFSFMAYKKAHSVCNGNCCGQTPATPKENGEMIIEAFSRQFASFISIQ